MLRLLVRHGISFRASWPVSGLSTNQTVVEERIFPGFLQKDNCACDARPGMRTVRTRLEESARAFAAVGRNRELRKLQLAFVGSITGEWGYLIALAVYANAHGGAKAVSLVLVLRWTGAALASPPLAVLVDRYPRRRIMFVTDVVRAISMAVM